jgi:hypothetical protein
MHMSMLATELVPMFVMEGWPAGILARLIVSNLAIGGFSFSVRNESLDFIN